MLHRCLLCLSSRGWVSWRDQWFLRIARIHVIIVGAFEALTLALLTTGLVSDWVVLLRLATAGAHVNVSVVRHWTHTS